MSEAELHELQPPPDAREKGGHEVLRCFVVDGGLSVGLRRSFDNPGTWGILLADLARHAARIYALESDVSEDEADEQPAAEDAVTGHLDPAQLESMTAADLRKMADDMGIKGAKGKNKAQLIAEICAQEVSVAAEDAAASPDDL